MKINYSKTKEMLLCPLLKLNVPSLYIDYNVIESVSAFKLLGVHVSNICNGIYILTIFVLSPILACVILKERAGLSKFLQC